MAYYAKMNDRTTRDQKRRQAEKRGGFNDEGSKYQSTHNDNRTDKPVGSRTAKPYGSYAEKSGNRSDKPYGNRTDKPVGGRTEKPYGSYAEKSGNRSDKPYGNRTDKPYGNRTAKPYGSYAENSGNRSDKPYSNRTDQPAGGRTEKPFNGYGDKPYGNRTGKPTGNRPYKPTAVQTDRPQNGRTDQRRDFRPKYNPGTAKPDNNMQFAPRSTSTYRTRGEGITPKPYGERRMNQQQDRQTEYTAYRPEAPREEAVAENLLSGRNPIREALKSGRDIEKLMIAKGELSGSAKEIVAMARQQHVPVQEVDRVRLDAITPNHQGMLAFASAYQYHTVDEMLALAKDRNEKPFLVMLDGVTDPHNLGAVIRSAECAGAHGVIVQERRAVGLTPAAVKASAGAIEHIMVSRVVNLTATLDMLKKQGIWSYAADTKGEDYTTVDFSGGVVLVIGAEGEGISRLVLEKCDKTVALPICGQIDSLNASVAAGILLYAVLRFR